MRTVDEVQHELNSARMKFQEFPTAHHGIAVIHEEFTELQTEVYARNFDKAAARKEAIQIAAMAIRFVEDICDE
jgi:hypothetical protein